MRICSFLAVISFTIASPFAFAADEAQPEECRKVVADPSADPLPPTHDALFDALPGHPEHPPVLTSAIGRFLTRLGGLNRVTLAEGQVEFYQDLFYQIIARHSYRDVEPRIKRYLAGQLIEDEDVDQLIAIYLEPHTQLDIQQLMKGSKELQIGLSQVDHDIARWTAEIEGLNKLAKLNRGQLWTHAQATRFLPELLPLRERYLLLMGKYQRELSRFESVGRKLNLRPFSSTRR